MKEKIAKLKISGQVFIWKYSDNTGNYPGWNLTVDKLASEELSNLFDMMSKCEWSTSKTVRTSKPMETEIAVPNNQNGNAKWSTRPAIIFCTKSNLSPHHWIISEMPDSLEINFGKQKLQKLKEAIISIPNGNGDFSISDENQTNILTFWWNLRK
jgi:hypothetical protein